MEKNWPADQVERRPIDSLIPYARNSRTHSDEQVDQIAASMQEWGWTNPVLVDEEGNIIAGHGRIMAGKKLGYKEVPVMVAKGWTEAQKRGYLIADNRLGELANWDMTNLIEEADFLLSEGFDVDLTGIDEQLLNAAADTFEPNLNPHKSKNEVTDADVQKSQNKLDDFYNDPLTKQTYIDVICPECGHEFKVTGS